VDKQAAIDATRRWISSVVIGLNLCPFARRVFEADRIRYLVSDAEDERALLEDLAAALRALASSPAVETTLLIHPRVLGSFLDYNDFLDAAERLVGELGLRGVVQIASFHPDYQFAGSAPDAVENYTNRSPHAMLHLLREESISAVSSEKDDHLDIPRRNIETLRGLGREKMLGKLKEIADGAK
jgi:hypothetical protein